MNNNQETMTLEMAQAIAILKFILTCEMDDSHRAMLTKMADQWMSRMLSRLAKELNLDVKAVEADGFRVFQEREAMAQAMWSTKQ